MMKRIGLKTLLLILRFYYLFQMNGQAQTYRWSDEVELLKSRQTADIPSWAIDRAGIELRPDRRKRRRI